MKSLCVVALAALFATSVMADEAKGPAKPDLAKGETISKTVCAACHTADGSRGIPTNPILQGQHADYLVKQLTEFKAGKRDNAVMKPMASTLSEDDMRNVAAFYQSKSAKAGQSKHKETVALGEKIWRGGIAEKSVPAWVEARRFWVTIWPWKIVTAGIRPITVAGSVTIPFAFV